MSRYFTTYQTQHIILCYFEISAAAMSQMSLQWKPLLLKDNKVNDQVTVDFLKNNHAFYE